MEETKRSVQLKAGEMILLIMFAAVAIGVLILVAVGAAAPDQKPEDAPETSLSQSIEESDAALLDYWSTNAEPEENGTQEDTHGYNHGGTAEIVDTHSSVEWTDGWD